MAYKVVCIAALAAALIGPNSEAGPVGVVPGRILVKGRGEYRPDVVVDAVRPFSGNQVDTIAALGIQVLEVPEGNWQKALSELKRNSDIEFAEPDYIIAADAIPTDPSYVNQWHLSKIQANAAWDKTTGSSSVIIAILDTGVESSHPDLAPHLVSGWNFYDNNSNTADVHGHGTAVAGTAAAAINNGIGIAGVAGTCKIMPIRTADPAGLAYESTIAKALTWAADHGARVANISFRVSGSSTVSTAAQYFQNKGGVVAVSAGNDAVFDSAADNPYMLTVSATDSNDAIASFSNTGNNIDLAAPGVSVLTTSMGGSYSYWSGTSFSAPIVAGTAGLVFSANPNLSGAQAADLIRKAADDLGAGGFDTRYGYGRVNVSRAVNNALALLPAPPPPPPPAPDPTPSPTGSQEAIIARSGGSLRKNWTGPVGFKFVAAASTSVTHLGRWVVAGNTGTHTVRLLNNSLSILASVSVPTAGATAGQFAYVDLAAPVTITAGQTYFLLCDEINGGDSWYDFDEAITPNISIIASLQSAYGAGTVGLGQAYGTPSFKFGSSNPAPIVAQDAITARSGGLARNDWTGPVGFRFVAAASTSITHLGRWVSPGNSRTHTVRLLNSSLSVLGSVSISTSGASVGQFAYVDLAAPVAVNSGQIYFVLSDEISGGDAWYDYDETITPNTSVIASMQSAYSAGIVSVGQAYGPAGFKFSSSNPNPLPSAAQEAISARSGGLLRNDWTGPVGFKFIAAAGATVTHLGRWISAGNSGTHSVQLLNSSLAIIATATVNASGATAGQFAYTALGTPANLVAGQAYFVLVNETFGGDTWYKYDETITPDTAVIGSMQSAYGPGLLGPGNAYGPAGFKFSIP